MPFDLHLLMILYPHEGTPQTTIIVNDRLHEILSGTIIDLNQSTFEIPIGEINQLTSLRGYDSPPSPPSSPSPLGNSSSEEGSFESSKSEKKFNKILETIKETHKIMLQLLGLIKMLLLFSVGSILY